MKDSDIRIFISVIGVLVFNWPFLEIFRERVALIGIAEMVFVTIVAVAGLISISVCSSRP